MVITEDFKLAFMYKKTCTHHHYQEKYWHRVFESYWFVVGDKTVTASK